MSYIYKYSNLVNLLLSCKLLMTTEITKQMLERKHKNFKREISDPLKSLISLEKQTAIMLPASVGHLNF